MDKLPGEKICLVLGCADEGQYKELGLLTLTGTVAFLTGRRLAGVPTTATRLCGNVVGEGKREGVGRTAKEPYEGKQRGGENSRQR